MCLFTGAGDCYDNAMCESFFATLECALLDRQRFRTQAEARMAVFEFIDGWYNPHRRHSSLKYLSPVNYEKRHAQAAWNRNPSPVHRTGVTPRWQFNRVLISMLECSWL